MHLKAIYDLGEDLDDRCHRKRETLLLQRKTFSAIIPIVCFEKSMRMFPHFHRTLFQMTQGIKGDEKNETRYSSRIQKSKSKMRLRK